MKKKEILVVVALLLVGIVWYAINYFNNLNATYVKVRDINTATIVDKINLNKDGYYSYDGAYGKFNLEVKDGRVRAVDVECPNHNCEGMGAISKEYPGLGGIICIPNGFEVFLDE